MDGFKYITSDAGRTSAAARLSTVSRGCARPPRISVRCVRPGGWLYDVETLAAPWVRGGPTDPLRRLTLPELTDEIARTGFDAVECTYHIRDRVMVKARRPSAPVRRPPQQTDTQQDDPGG